MMLRPRTGEAATRQEIVDRIFFYLTIFLPHHLNQDNPQRDLSPPSLDGKFRSEKNFSDHVRIKSKPVQALLHKYKD